MPWWAFVIVILVVAGVTCGLWGFVLLNRSGSPAGLGPTPTPIFVVITNTPTLGPPPETPSPTPDLSATTTSPPTGLPSPAAGVTPTLPTLPIEIGSTVVIAGTEGDGLAIRQGPGVDYPYFFVGNDGDTFVIEDGPREADGYTWWYIVDPTDADRAGWAVETFLQAVAP